MGTELLKVKNLKKYYTTKKSFFSRDFRIVKAVDDVSFNIMEGSTFGLVGESGCGKSTTARTILNLLEPSGGTVEFNNEIIYNVENSIYLSKEEMRRKRKEMQIIFQDPYASLDPRMNIGDIVTEGLKKHNIAQGNDAVNMAKEFLELCGLRGDSINKYPHEFSGGQRQRIGIARSMVLKPKFIIGDEPISALDVSIQAQVTNLLIDLKEKFKLTYLFISHDLSFVRYFCDRVAVMYLGSIVEIGDSEEVFNKKFHPYTKSLISAIPTANPMLRTNRIILEGDVPSPSNPPNGCKFHTRCKYCTSICKEQIPTFEEVDKGYFVACHNWQSIN
ncbi:oligopeptide transport ATP-binding protein OppF [Clostridium puniceum]|uniref:Oligopeptide transport ATP-binding protein OppF n=1 Tax=Clostridium puniceum TaxID=29367 RepID=A0A1S8TWI9_9CLOT|nr:ABC transporter ATP-binding protein [Clostridium puniceum]OOM82088.1 oligopeptide transport ATP-binding protein OppF [Clostridium puniceum]